MEKRKNFLKDAIVLLIVSLIIVPSIDVIANNENDNNKMQKVNEYYSSLKSNNLKSENIQIPSKINKEQIENKIKFNTGIFGRSLLFSQRYYLPTESWNFYNSAVGGGYLCYDDFYGFTDLITKVEFYGLVLIYSGGWIQGDPTGMIFEIIFYPDVSGTPGVPSRTFTVTPSAIDTGIVYGGTSLKMYKWSVDLSPSVNLVPGWISIQSISCPDSSWFLWSGSPEGTNNALQNGNPLDDNLAFNLYGENIPPVAVGDTYNICYPTTSMITFDVLNNDFDPDGHSFLIDPFSTPLLSGATVNNDPSQTKIEYNIPATGFTPGTDIFTYTITDNGIPPLTSATATVTINVCCIEILSLGIPPLFPNNIRVHIKNHCGMPLIGSNRVQLTWEFTIDPVAPCCGGTAYLTSPSSSPGPLVYVENNILPPCLNGWTMWQSCEVRGDACFTLKLTAFVPPTGCSCEKIVTGCVSNLHLC